MKRLLFTLVIGLVAGFGIGAYTPVADYLSLQQFATTFDGTEDGDVVAEAGEVEQSPFEKLKAMIDVVKSEGSEARGALGPVEEAISKVRSGNWVMAYEDVSQSEDPIARASLQAEGGQKQRTAEEQETLDFLNAAQAGMAAENESYNARIAQMEEDHPETYFLKILVESNNSMMTYIQHLIDLDAVPLTIETLAQLQGSLDASEQKIVELADQGLDSNAGWAAVAKIIPAKTDADRAMKAQLEQIFATYNQSFANEKTLAAKMSEYPSLLAMEMASGGDGSMIAQWGGELAALADTRTALQNQRSQLANDIMMATPSS